jgi:signal transduction histidine kinase
VAALSPPTEAVLNFLGGSGFLWSLLIALAVSLGLAAYAWRRTASVAARDLSVAAGGLFGCLVIWTTFNSVFRIGQLPRELWMGPFDRLVGVACLIVLGWALTATHPDVRRWRRFLGAGLVATVLAYAGWAPLWAREFHLRPWLMSDPTGLSRAWDAWSVALAIAVGVAVFRRAPRPGAWLAGVFGGLALGSLFELMMPLSVVFPAWSRLGTLFVGALFVGAAVVQVADLVNAPLSRLTGRGAPAGTSARSAWRPAGRPDEGESIVDLGLGVEPDVLADQALRLVAARMGATPAFIGLLTSAGDLDVRVLGGPGREPRRLGALPLADLPTLARALNEGRISLRSNRLAPDLQRLYGLVTAPDGAVLLQRIGAHRGLGVLVAGRPRAPWEAHHQVTLAAIARGVAAGVEAGDTARAGTSEVDRALGALEAQATAVTRLSRSVDGLARRVGELESVVTYLQPGPGATASAGGPPAPTPLVPGLAPGEVEPVPVAPVPRAPEPVVTEAVVTEAVATEPPVVEAVTPAARPAAGPGDRAVDTAPRGGEARARDEMNDRVPRYERALERLPWGVVVVDAGGTVAFANSTAAAMLHLAAITPGAPASAVFPDADRIEIALHRARQRALSSGTGEVRPVEVRFESPLLRVELEPLCDPTLGYLGAVAVVDHGASTRMTADDDLVRALSEALRTPMTMILGYSDLLTRGTGLNEEHLERFLQRIDANLARMQVMLGNLLTVIELDRVGTAMPAPQPVDVAQVLQNAVARAKAQFAEKALVVRLDIDGPLPPASADPAALQQIVDNLLINAALRSPQGGDITVALKVREDLDNRAVVISVHDRGTQVGGATTGVVEIDETGTTPVSLRVVRLLTTRQGGRAWAETDRRGARFFVRLPVRRAA